VNSGKIVNLLEHHVNKKAELEKSKDLLMLGTNKTWPKGERLRELKIALQEVDKKIEKTIKTDTLGSGTAKREDGSELRNRKDERPVLKRLRL
jgi:hypothetical protein